MRRPPCLAALRAALLLLALAPAAARAGDAAPAPAQPDPTYLAELTARARAAGLADEVGWLRLLHYEKRWLGGWKSQVDGPEFFRAKEGKYDPAAELTATLAGFLDPARGEDELTDAQCRFPARFAYLDGKLGFDRARMPLRPCPRRDDFLGKISPVGVTLVFSSFYLNNPASSFGHTLLRLDKAPEARSGKHFELLDYGVDYAATIDSSNAIVYAFKGLFGLFKGEFKYYAYYYKVRQYGDYESRDLWEYDLDLAPAEVALLGAHVWEMGGSWLRYWYLDENCAYHVLSVLESAAPRLRLVEHLGSLAVLPSDTVRALFAQPGLVRQVHYRPSVRTQFEARVAGLDGDGRAAADHLVHDPATPMPAGASSAQQAAILDAALDLVDLRHFRELLEGTNPRAARLRQALLVRRAELGVPSAPLDVALPEHHRVETGHSSIRAGLGGGAVDGAGGAVDLDLRLALHGLDDPPRGYPGYAQIDFLPARLRFLPRERRAELEEFWLVRVISLNPVSRFDTRPSWRMGFGATTVHDRGCDRCVAADASLGAGFTLGDLGGALDLLGTADLDVLVSSRLAGAGGSWVRPGVGPSLLARLRLGEQAVLLGDARWRWLPAAEPRTSWSLGATLRWNLSTAYSIGLEGRKAPADARATALVYAFF